MLVTVLLGLSVAARARADCEPGEPFSPCFTADPLWISAGPARFVSVAPAEITAPSHLVIGLAASHATHSVTLEAPSPDPDGRELPIVERTTTVTLLAAYGFRSHTELSLAIPQTLDQAGLGAGGISAQSGNGLAKHPLRDPRLGFAQQLWTRESTVRMVVAARYTLVIPVGNEEEMAGERGFVGAPSFTAGVERGRWFVSSEIGARFRQPARFANARLGSQLLVATGAGFDLVTEHRLTFAAEASLAPTLVAQPDGAFGRPGTLAPAEWLVSVSTAPLGKEGPAFVLGGGGGLPTSTTAEGESYTGLTSPALRLVALVRQPLVL